MLKEARTISNDVRVQFVWREDRFEHSIRSDETKFESSSSEDLLTPVYQEVHQQGDVIFASGMSGDAHWSASVEPTERGLLFDVACRGRSIEGPLGVCYRTTNQHTLPVIGKAAGESPPPELITKGDQLRIVAKSGPKEGVSTIRFRYEVGQEQECWISNETDSKG